MHYFMMLDLKDDEQLMAEYESYHRQVWQGVLDHIHQSGVQQMEIYRLGNRLVMWMKVDDDFSFKKMALAAADNEVVKQWEELMWQYQVPTPWTPMGEKWQLMTNIFSLNPTP